MLTKEQHNTKVQKLLKNRDYDLKVDGEWGPKSEDAWQDFTYRQVSMAGVGYRETNRYLPKVMAEYDSISVDGKNIKQNTQTEQTEQTEKVEENKSADVSEQEASEDAEPTENPAEGTEEVSEQTGQNEQTVEDDSVEDDSVESFNVPHDANNTNEKTNSDTDFLNQQRSKKKKKKNK